jgi:hypothetical protein
MGILILKQKKAKSSEIGKSQKSNLLSRNALKPEIGIEKILKRKKVNKNGLHKTDAGSIQC